MASIHNRDSVEVEVKTVVKVGVIEVQMTEDDVKEAIADFITKHYGPSLPAGAVIYSCEPDIDWRGEEYDGFNVVFHRPIEAPRALTR